MADNTAKNVAIAGGVVAVLGGLFAALKSKSTSTAPMRGAAPAPPKLRKGCGCGR